LVDGNLKKKTFDPEKIYLVNHENDSIYNDIVKFNKENLKDVIKQF